MKRHRLRELQETWNKLNLEELVKKNSISKRRKVLSKSIHIFGFVHLTCNFLTTIVQFTLIDVHVFPDEIFGSPSLRYLGVVFLAIDEIIFVGHGMLYVNVIFCTVTALMSFEDIVERKKNSESYSQLIDWGLVNHDRLADFVEFASNVFSFYALVELGFAVPTFTMELYVLGASISNSKDSWMFKVQIAVFVMVNFIQLCAVCYAAVINGVAKNVRKKFQKIYIHYTSVMTDSDGNNDRKATALMSQLQDEVAFTIFDLIPMTKGFLLTMSSVIFNYFFLLLSFQQQWEQLKGGNQTSTGI